MTDELKPRRRTAVVDPGPPLAFVPDERELEAEELYAQAKEIFQDDLVDPEAVERVSRGLLPPKPRGLHAKLAEMLEEVGYLQKTGTAPAAMGGFKFVEAAEAADRVRRSLAAKGISMLPVEQSLQESHQYTTKSGSNQFLVTIKTRWQLTDSESGETAEFESLGSGQDGSDKAIPKAQTNAMKYAILMGWLIPTGEDPERFVNEEILAPAPIVIQSSNLPGVQQGGRQALITTPQVEAILGLARTMNLDPDDFRIIVTSIAGTVMDDGEWRGLDDGTKRQVVRNHLNQLTFEQAAGVIQALSAATN